MSSMDPTRGMAELPLLPAFVKMVNALPSSLMEILDWFNSKNARVWIVGGANRNAILGTEINEYDLATTMTPAEMKNIQTQSLQGNVMAPSPFETKEIVLKSQHYEPSMATTMVVGRMKYNGVILSSSTSHVAT